MNLSACAGLARNPENGTWYRLIDPHLTATALSSIHTKGIRSRFIPGPLISVAQQFETLYLADDPTAAVYEIGAMLGRPWVPGSSAPHPKRTYLTLNVTVVLHEVVDLTDVPAAQMPLQTNAQELTGDWGCYAVRSSMTPVFDPRGISPSQELGRELFLTSGIEAFWAISAKVPYHRNIVIFPQKLHSGSYVAFRDPGNPGGPPVHRIP